LTFDWPTLYYFAYRKITEVIMKNIKAFVSMAAFAVVTALTAPASAQDVKQGVVTIVRIQGDARYSAGDNVWHKLTPGMTVGGGDVIETGADSIMDIVLGEKSVQVHSNAGSPIGGVVNIAGLPITPIHGQATPQQNVIRLQPNTVLAVDKFIYSQTGADTVTDTELDLRAGKIFGNVKKISAASKYIVKTPTGVAGIRGTAFLLGSDGSVTVLEGSVVISSVGLNNQVITSVLSAGDEYNPQTGQVVHNINFPEFIAALATAKALVVTVNELVTVDITQTPNGGDKTTIVISPTSGHSDDSGTIIVSR
jgi:hypothetical protein